jgi:hypothetical protein
MKILNFQNINLKIKNQDNNFFLFFIKEKMNEKYLSGWDIFAVVAYFVLILGASIYVMIKIIEYISR